MRLNRSTSHAIRIALDCAGSGDQLIKVADLSDRLGITRQNVFKIVHILSRAGLLTAMRGRNGGVKLARPAGEIRVGDVVRAMETTEIALLGVSRSKASRRISIDVNRVLDDALEAFVSILDQHTLAELAAEKGAASGREARSRTPRKRSAAPAKRPQTRADVRRAH